MDTWGWLVLANEKDPAFAAVRRMWVGGDGRKGRWVTTDYVLDEAITRVFAACPFRHARAYFEGIFAASQEGLVDIEQVTPERFQAAWQMRLRYRDKPRISFTDLTSFAVMRELEISYALTGDAHFEQVGLGFRRTPGAVSG